jgi:hypothetical protein
VFIRVYLWLKTIHAAIALPPGMLVPTPALAEPLCLRWLDQKAVNHTFAPGAVVPGNVTSTTVRDVFPSNFQPPSSLGATAPTKPKHQ